MVMARCNMRIYIGMVYLGAWVFSLVTGIYLFIFLRVFSFIATYGTLRLDHKKITITIQTIG